MARSPFRLGLTRDQLASFLQDFEQIKQFERLFQVVDDEVNPNSVTSATILAGNADAKAQQALDTLERIANALDALALAPTADNGEILNDLADLKLSPPIEHNGSIATNYIDYNLNTPAPVPFIGRTFWNGGQTISVQQTLNVAGKVNEDNFYYIKADSTISKGQLIMFTGAVGSSGVLRGAPATGLGVNDGVRLMGVAAENIANNGFGLVQWSGTLRGFNTTGAPYGEVWADGDILYYNPAFVGGLTKVEPTAPNVRAVIAAVVNAGSGGSGSIVIRLTVGSVLGGTDSNVYINSLANDDLLQYDGIQQRWENHTAASVTVGKATNVDGGAANRIVYQTAAGVTGFIVAPTIANTYLEWSGSAFQWSTNPLGTVTSVNLTAGTGISVSGGPITTSGSITVTNTAPDQIVSITGAGTSVVTGTYPNFTITSNDQFVGTVTSVSGTGSVNGITLSGTVTSSGNLTLGGTLSGVSLTTQVTGTLPVTNGGTGTATAFTAGSVIFAGASGVYSQDNATFFWDDTNNRLGIGTTAPVDTLTVAGGNIANVILGSGANLQMGRLAMYSTALGGAYVTYGGEIRSYSGAGIDVSDLRFYTANGAPTVERVRINPAGFTQFLTNLAMPYQPAPTTKAGAATLTGAELITGILSYTGNAQTVNFPTGTNIEGALAWVGNNVSLDFFVINTGTGTCTMGANGNTTLGALAVTAGTSAQFRVRRTGTNAFTIYRLG